MISTLLALSASSCKVEAIEEIVEVVFADITLDDLLVRVRIRLCATEAPVRL